MLTQLLFVLFVFSCLFCLNIQLCWKKDIDRHRGLFVSVKRYCFLTAKMCVHCGKDFSALGRLVFFSTECSLDNSFV